MAVTRGAFDASKNLAEQEALAAARRNRMVSEGCVVSKSPLLQVRLDRPHDVLAAVWQG